MNKTLAKRNVALIILLLALSQVVMVSWETWSSYELISDYREAFDPSTTFKIIEKTKNSTAANPDNMAAINVLESASNDLKMLNNFLQVNIQGAEQRLKQMFYIICGLVVFIFGLVGYVVFQQKKF